MNNERDKWDDLFRLKLQDMEIDTMPEDWEGIAQRLPEAKRVPFRRWVWAAAVFAALVVGGGSLYLSRLTDTNTTFTAQPTVSNTPSAPVVTPAIPLAPPNSQTVVAVAAKPLRQPVAVAAIIQEAPVTTEEMEEEMTEDIKQEPVEEEATTPTIDTRTLIADAAPIPTENNLTSSRKWSFGAGIGGLTQNSGETVNTYVLRSSSKLEDEELLALNAAPDQNHGKLPRTNIKHKIPLSFGLSVSRALNNRFSFQTGLVYSLLISDWETQATAYNTKTRQTLHFVGIPLSLSYKIAEWNRFHLYASAGALTQVNLVGGLKVRRFSDDLQTGVSYENQRMKEWQWSVSAQAGITYPLFPHINAFAEIGAAYYFENGSAVETIYSDKPFNINPQIGFRLSF
jgi:hypothetical protein